MTATERIPNGIRVVLGDHRGRLETIDLAPGTVELVMPHTSRFTAYGAIPNHLHHQLSEDRRAMIQIAVFVSEARCRHCQARS